MRRHFMPRELTALTRLGALRHFYLKLLGSNEVLWRHPEARGRHLLDRAVRKIAVFEGLEPLSGLTTFSSVALGTEPVHRDCDRAVSLGAECTDGHRRSGESLHDILDRLHFLKRNWSATYESEHVAERGRLVAKD